MPEIATLISFFLQQVGHHATPEVTTLISYNFCDLWDTMPCEKSPLSFPTQPIPREAEDFPRGGNHPKDVMSLCPHS